MKKLSIAIMALLLICPQLSNAQDGDTTKSTYTLDEVTISANKIEETKKTVPQQVMVLTAKDIEDAQSQSTADLIASTGNVAIQKSQLGGGSAVIRGFEASRILLVIDGVRMNNLIYRAGHHQNLVTLDNGMLDRVEILFGPSSTIYGSDALGGVIHLFSKNPKLAFGDKNSLVKVNFGSRYGGSDNELMEHLDFNYGTKKFASLTSFTYSKFSDLRGGRNQNPFYDGSYGERPYYVERFNDRDSLVKNDDRYLQKQSGYSQYDLLQKFLFQQTEKLSHGVNIQYSNNPYDVPRYDRLTDPGTGPNGLKSAEWYYGPQKRLMAAYDMNIKDPEGKLQWIHFGLNYQSLEESRHNRNFGSRYKSHRIENVNVIGANLDFQKIAKSHNIRFGLDAQLNSLKSTANKEDILMDTTGVLDTRYPDGDNSMNNFGVYFSHTWKLTDHLTLTDGIRGGMSMMNCTLVDTATQFHLPYTDIKQQTPFASGSIGLIHSPSDDLKFSMLFSTGFRVPNVDDMAKIFSSVPGAVIVPNTELKAEKTYNYEMGVTKIFEEKTRWENCVYYTRFADAIVTAEGLFDGKDSLMYDGTLSKVYTSKNFGEAYLYGVSSNLRGQLDDNFYLALAFNYTYGRVKTDSSDRPLDHIPPITSRLSLSYVNKNLSTDFFINYNGWKKLKDYALGGEDNEQYATPLGMPAWFTVNLHMSYKIHKYISLQAGVDNIFDTQYRTFASGINGAGRNIFGALRFHY